MKRGSWLTLAEIDTDKSMIQILAFDRAPDDPRFFDPPRVDS